MHIASCQRCRCHPLFALGAVKMPTGEIVVNPRRSFYEREREERQREMERARDELRCHSHLRRVNYVLFIIMRSTHALTTVVSDTNNQTNGDSFPIYPSPYPKFSPLSPTAFHIHICDYS